MMELRPIDATFAVAPQMQPEELVGPSPPMVSTAVICNRPMAEEPGSAPRSRKCAVLRRRRGLAFHHIPVAGGLFPPAAVGRIRRDPGAARRARCWPIVVLACVR